MSRFIEKFYIKTLKKSPSLFVRYQSQMRFQKEFDQQFIPSVMPFNHTPYGHTSKIEMENQNVLQN